MELEIKQENTEWQNVLHLSENEKYLFSKFKEIADEEEKKWKASYKPEGISYGEHLKKEYYRDRRIFGSDFVEDLIIPYVVQKIGLSIVNVDFNSTGTVWDNIPYVYVTCKERNFVSKKFPVFGDYQGVRLTPVIQFGYNKQDEDTLIASARLEKEELSLNNKKWTGTTMYSIITSYFDVIQDAAALLAEQERIKGKSDLRFPDEGTYWYYVAPITAIRESFRVLHRAFKFLINKKEDLEKLETVKSKINYILRFKSEDKKRYLKEDKPILDALVLGYNKQLEKSLEGILEFFRFPI